MPQRLDRRQGGEGPTPRTPRRLGPAPRAEPLHVLNAGLHVGAQPFLQVDRVVLTEPYANRQSAVLAPAIGL